MRRLTSKILAIFTLSTTVTLTCYAITTAPQKKQTTVEKNKFSIVGNPIGRKDNYTINSTKERTVKLHCVFVNTGKDPAKLNIWTMPNATTPEASIDLPKAGKHKPYKIVKRFTLNLKPYWWCRIYTPQKELNEWKNCSYFSISDATITKENPFDTWNKTIRSRDTSYHCRIQKPRGKVSFFHFKYQ